MPDPVLPKRKKVFDPKDSNPCEGCSNCCEYIAVNLDNPSTVNDFDEIVWFLIHKDVWVYIDDEDDWYIQFNTVCDKLENRRCGYYPHRPKICRAYQPKDCVRYNEDAPEKYLFKNELDLYRYMAKRRPKTFEKLKEKINIPFEAKQLVKDYVPAAI